jgi:hypothetical protein
LSQTRADGSTETMFYDPWWQLGLSSDPAKPKVFLEAALAEEMTNLLRITKLSSGENLISATETLIDLHTSEAVKNTSRDFAYFIACSTGAFSNPTELRPDPSMHSYAASCVIS